MNPIGLALAFALFWFLVGAGLFLIVWILVRVAKPHPTFGLMPGSSVRLKGRDLLLAAIILPVGAILAYLGLAASFNTILR